MGSPRDKPLDVHRKMLKTKDVIEILRISKTKLKKHIREGRLQADGYEIHGQRQVLLFHEDTVARFVNSMRVIF